MSSEQTNVAQEGSGRGTVGGGSDTRNLLFESIRR